MSEEKQPASRKRRCSSECKDHLFLISHFNDPKYDCQVAFCPKYYREPKSPENTFPSFNFDQKEYTSAFILGVDRKTLAKNEKEEQAEYKRQVSEALQKRGQIVFPKPRKVNNRCAVCKDDFKGYFKHIMSQSHKQKIAQNQYNNLIVHLSSQYNNLQGSEAPAPIRFVSSTGQQTNFTEAVQNQQKNIINFTELIISSDSSAEAGYSYQTHSQQLPKQDQLNSTIARTNALSEKQQTNTESNRLESDEDATSGKGQKELESLRNDTDSDSVEIVKVKPAKKPKASLNQPPSENDTNFKTKSISKKSKKNSSEKKSKKKKSQKEKKKKSKSRNKDKKKKQKEDLSDDEESDAMRRRKNSIKRRPLDPPPSNPPLIHRRMMAKATPFRGGQRPAHPAEVRPQQILIQKYVVQDPILDISMQKILANLCNSISKGPPALAPRQYRRADDSNLPKSIMRSRINVANQNNHQNSNQLQNQRQKSTDKELSKSRDRSEGSLSESGVSNNVMAISSRKDNLNQKLITNHGSFRASIPKAKTNIFSSILEDQKNKRNGEVIEVGGDEDSELSQTKSVNKFKGNSLQQASGSIKGKSNQKNPSKTTSIQPVEGIAQQKVDKKPELYPIGSEIQQNNRLATQKALSFSKPLVLFKKKLQNNGQIKSIGVIDLSIEQQDHVSELMKHRKGALKQSNSWGEKGPLAIIQKDSFIVSKKE